MNSITAKEILKLLKARHSEDVFVPECKDGPTNMGHFRMDAWAMARSWSRPRVAAYEIKISRSDFLGDDKWHGYLPCCNQFSFVTLKGLIQPQELPADIGLYFVASTGNRLLTVRKPVFRSVIIPENLWRYLLMCRAMIGKEREEGGRQSLEYWRDWIAEKEETRQLGMIASKAIRKLCLSLQNENRELREQMKAYDGVKAALAEIGLSGSGRWITPETVKRMAQRRLSAVPDALINSVDRAIGNLQVASDELKKVRSEALKREESEVNDEQFWKDVAGNDIRIPVREESGKL